MKKLLVLFLFAFLSTLQALAIDWQPVYLNGQICTYIDSDSIEKTDKYYFYNIKFTTREGDILVVTLQSSLSSPFSARVRIYSLDEYMALKGNYEHTKDNQKEDLEAVTYGSIVSAAYKYVKIIDIAKNNNSIIINEE